MVQEFLVQAEEEVEEEMAEDLSAGELQEKLKRLESLQQLQLCNEDKVTTIERSAESEEVRKALQKNPDISKERSNLLQGGWGHTPHTHSCTNSTCTHHSAPLQSYHLPSSQPPHPPHLSLLTHTPHSSHPHTHLSLLTPTHLTHPHSSHTYLSLLTPTHTHTPHTLTSSHPHRLVSCLIHTEGQTREDEEESRDGARPGGGPAHHQ